MSLFVIADLHLPLGADKPMDIFGGWDNYVERLRNNWQSLVSPQDTVVIPGDVSWAMKLEDSLPDFKFIENLNGTKIISKGNHDYWWGTLGKMEKFFADNGITTVKILHNNYYRYCKSGICGTRGWINETGEPADAKVAAREAGRLEMSICAAENAGLEPLVFMHYPPLNALGVNEPIMKVLKAHEVKTCFYGHIHGRKNHAAAVKGVVDGVDYHLISGDYLQFAPKNIDKFVQSDE